MAKQKTAEMEREPVATAAPVAQPLPTRKYRVSLLHNPTLEIEAGDPETAFEAYKATQNILGSAHPPKVELVG